MTNLFRSANLATKFQILVEVAANQPDIQQRDIAERLDLSPQAVSDYFKELAKDGWLVSKGRSKYRITPDGVGWLIRGLAEWQEYSNAVRKAIISMSVSTAIADSDLSAGQKVGLVMKDGLLFASDDSKGPATGAAISKAKKGEDVGVTSIDGIVSLEVGKVTILRMPGIERRGSSGTDLEKLKEAVRDKRPVAAKGIEALVALRKAGVEPDYRYGVNAAVVEAARCGLSPVVVCVDDNTADLLKALEEKGVDYDIVDVRHTRRRIRHRYR